MNLIPLPPPPKKKNRKKVNGRIFVFYLCTEASVRWLPPQRAAEKRLVKTPVHFGIEASRAWTSTGERERKRERERRRRRERKKKEKEREDRDKMSQQGTTTTKLINWTEKWCVKKITTEPVTLEKMKRWLCWKAYLVMVVTSPRPLSSTRMPDMEKPCGTNYNNKETKTNSATNILLETRFSRDHWTRSTLSRGPLGWKMTNQSTI